MRDSQHHAFAQLGLVRRFGTEEEAFVTALYATTKIYSTSRFFLCARSKC